MNDVAYLVPQYTGQLGLRLQLLEKRPRDEHVAAGQGLG